jgi:hypothetical protein
MQRKRHGATTGFQNRLSCFVSPWSYLLKGFRQRPRALDRAVPRKGSQLPCTTGPKGPRRVGRVAEPARNNTIDTYRYDLIYI